MHEPECTSSQCGRLRLANIFYSHLILRIIMHVHTNVHKHVHKLDLNLSIVSKRYT